MSLSPIGHGYINFIHALVTYPAEDYVTEARSYVTVPFSIGCTLCILCTLTPNRYS